MPIEPCKDVIGNTSTSSVTGFDPTGPGASGSACARAKEVVEDGATPRGRSSQCEAYEAASKTIVRAFRNHIAKSAYSHMTETGEIWRADPKGGRAVITSLSRKNIDALRENLGDLTSSEKEFMKVLLAQKFFATHATQSLPEDAVDPIALFSRKKLVERKIPFAEQNTWKEDIKKTGCDDFVHFALEIGDAPKKPASRFGPTMYRVNFDEAVFRDTAWLSLTELLFPVTPDAKRLMSYLKSDESASRHLQPLEIVFSGGAMKTGLALSIIKEAREFSPASQQKVLESTTEDQLNGLVNGLYRPEVKVPRHCFIQNATGVKIDLYKT